MSSNLSNVTVAQLKRAIVLRERIEKLESQLSGVLGGVALGSANGVGRRTMSAAARARIAAAQKLRWAKQKKGGASGGRRTMSPAARARIAAAARLRWKKAKAAGKTTLAA